MNHNKRFTIILITIFLGIFALMIHTTAHAMSMGPWERADDTYQPLVQPVTNGNEIYYSLNTSQYLQYIKQAITDWNNLNVIKLVPVATTDARSQISITTSPTDDGDTPTVTADTEYGMSSSVSGSGKIPANTQTLTGAVISLKPHFKTVSNAQKTYTIEHEIGHTLGFAHDNRTVNKHKLIMYWNTSKQQYPLGGLEQRMLAYYYQLPIQGLKLTTKY